MLLPIKFLLLPNFVELSFKRCQVVTPQLVDRLGEKHIMVVLLLIHQLNELLDAFFSD